MKKVLMLYYTINDNYGDVLIFNTAKKIFENEKYEVYYTEVGRPCNQLLTEANQYDFLLFAGGGIIERDIVNVIRYFKEDYYMLKVPYGVMGLSVGEFEHEEYNEQLKFFVENAKFFYARDQFTADYFNRICKREIVKYSSDVVFSYSNFDRFKNIQRDKIGINIRNIPYIDLTGDIEWDKLDKIINENEIQVLIPDEQEEYDKSLNNITVDLELEKNYNLSGSYEKTQIILGEIAKCSIVIAMRFHVVLTAAALGKIIPIPITYCPKCARLAEQLGIEELAITIHEIDKIPEKIEYAKQNREKLLNKIKINVEKMKLKNEEMFNGIFKKLSEEGL